MTAGSQRKAQAKTVLSEKAEKRLNEEFEKHVQNPASRIYQPTYKGYLAEQMHPHKGAVDNQPKVKGKNSRIPGMVGWGVSRKHLLAQHNIITDDMNCTWPIRRDHLKELDRQVTTKFCRFP